jgi:hypothetical protein
MLGVGSGCRHSVSRGSVNYIGSRVRRLNRKREDFVNDENR